ncbi:ABC transporter ATP-binding protein [Bacillaceae bacterium SIJ1]|nr:ABC transporter ATP-binding protein [Litoribacterium kuwaitense]
MFTEYSIRLYATLVIVPISFIISQFSWSLWINPFIFSMLTIWMLFRYSSQLSTINTHIRQQFGKVNADLNEAIDGIETVKANTLESHEEKRFSDNVQEYKRLSKKRVFLEAAYLPILVYYVFLGFALFQCLFLFQSGSLTIGETIAYLGLLTSMQVPIANSEITFSFISSGVVSARKILNTLWNTHSLAIKESGLRKEFVGRIEFRNVSFGYSKENLVLKNINFVVYPNETVALVGTTGSGKSTLVKLINRMYDPLEGEILIDEVNAKEYDIDCFRSQIGVIEQDIFLFSWSVRENVLFGKKANNSAEIDFMRALHQSQAHQFVQKLSDHDSTKIGENGVQLSGGQRQRLAMARAFMSSPKILIMDDATSAVDSETEHRIQKGMTSMMKGRTTLLITHRLSQIRQADRIIVLDKGEIKAEGTHEQLMKNCEEYNMLFSEKEPKPLINKHL